MFHFRFRSILVVNYWWHQVAISDLVVSYINFSSLCELVNRMNDQRTGYGAEDKCSSEEQINFVFRQQSPVLPEKLDPYAYS